MAQFVRVHALGASQRLTLEEGELDALAPNEVRVTISAIGLNRAEAAIREGTYVQRPTLPTRMGFEAAGVVTEVGGECDGLSVGDYVSFIPGPANPRYGTYATEAILPASLAVKTPPEIAPLTAAAMWMQYLTAYGGMVEAGGLAAGETVVITAASSSVGLAAIQIARRLGAMPIATTRSPDKIERLLNAGAAHVVCTRTELIDEKVQQITSGRGAELIFDCVAGTGVDALGRAAGFNGRIILYGALDAFAAPYPFESGIMKGLTMRAFHLLELTGKSEWLARAKAFTLEGVADGSLAPVIDRSFRLSDIAQAHDYLEEGTQFGKIMILP